ncbi:MAG: type II toxin-antitoxin system RelE/ParE family toxin [Cytophagales bacterium]
MPNYKLTKKAVEDLQNIWEYTFDTWSEQQADNYYDFLLNNCKDIANNPDLGKSYSSVKDGLFGFKSNKHIIFYRKFVNQPIEITRILHERMDLKHRI